MKDKKIVKTENNDVEMILRTKMNELSDSVDCFDRISERVFTETGEDFSEDAYVITDLENITGKPRISRIIKWTAIAAAAAFCIAVIPQSTLGRQMLSDIINNSSNTEFPTLIREIGTEVESGAYNYIDVPLDYYIENDVLVTPLFSCPFEDCDRDDANVRIYTKQIDGIDTTQVYAVLYSGKYTDNDILAAAESKYKFTAEDMTLKFDDKGQFLNSAENVLEYCFYGDDTMGNIYDSEGNNISAGSFINTVITKNKQGETIKQSNEFIIWHKNSANYFYDILFSDQSDENIFGEDMWERSVYFNGNSSLPVISESDFVKTDLVNSQQTEEALSDLTFVYPFEYDGNFPNPSDNRLILTLTTNPLSSYQTYLPVPINAEALLSLKVYFPTNVLSETDNITVYYDGSPKVLYPEVVISTSETEQDEIYEVRMLQKDALMEQERQIFEELQREKEKAEQIQKEALTQQERQISEELQRAKEEAERISKEAVQQQESLAEQELQRMEELQKKLGEVTKPIEN